MSFLVFDADPNKVLEGDNSFCFEISIY
jgi:hypothetical protein